MPTEPDLSALLPPAPPPRPDRREDAIAAAMRRFDGEAPVAAPAPPHRRRMAGRPQLGVLAAAALVAAIGLPLWLSDEHRPATPRTHAAAEPPRPAAAAPPADRAATLARVAPVVRAPGIVAAPVLDEAAPAPPAEERLRAADKEAPSPVAPPPAAVMAAPPPLPAFFAPPPPPPPPAPAASSAEESNVAGDIVVTSRRTTGRAAKAQARAERRLAARGDWNACTIDDPRRDPGACRSATPLVRDGLSRAWDDDLDGAIAAFDQAIATSPRLGPAWLNRGLAHARAGDTTRALADLDKAIRYAPRDPRGWFHRSLILRREGQTARADADAARAVDLDPRYEALLE